MCTEKTAENQRCRSASVQGTTKLTISGMEMKWLREDMRKIYKIMTGMKRADKDALFYFSSIASELEGIKLR